MSLALGAARDGYDWLTFGVTAVAAVGTLSAVLVALFGPRWHASRRAPVISLIGEDEDFEWIFDGDAPERPSDGPKVTLHNRRGRDPARDVEVFATVKSDLAIAGDLVPIPLADRERLIFSTPLDGYGHPSTSVPPNFSRRVFLLVLGDRRRIYAEMYPPGDADPDVMGSQVGALAVHPMCKDNVRWVASEDSHDVRLVVTGANFDAIAFEGSFVVDRADMGPVSLTPGDAPVMGDMVSLSFRWTRPLMRVGAP